MSELKEEIGQTRTMCDTEEDDNQKQYTEEAEKTKE
jgi:hypothetical protein